MNGATPDEPQFQFSLAGKIDEQNAHEQGQNALTGRYEQDQTDDGENQAGADEAPLLGGINATRPRERDDEHGGKRLEHIAQPGRQHAENEGPELSGSTRGLANGSTGGLSAVQKMARDDAVILRRTRQPKST